MTNEITNQEKLMNIINQNNISIDFLKSSIDDENYHNEEFNYNNLFHIFHSLDICAFKDFFHLLQKTEDELISFGKTSIDRLKIFLSQNNCSIGMFKDFSLTTFNALNNQKIHLQDLTPEEKSLSLTLINCLVKQYGNDMELGREIRKIFNTIK